MRAVEYRRLAETEQRMWWFDGLHRLLLAAFERHAPAAGPVLDAGCGTGGLLRRFAARHPGRPAYGVDPAAEAVGLARQMGVAATLRASALALPFAEGRFAAVFSADVLCHAAVDPPLALAEMRRCLMPGGAVILNLPAYGWMFSAHDRAVSNARRFTRGQVLALLRAAGFAQADAFYWNSLLFPLMVIQRKLLSTGEAASDVSDFNPILDRAFRGVLAVERRLIAAGIRLPFGGAIIAVGVK
ncbi:MAG: class I SAM-dependent methyltransferase [Thalassobaculales bacterium]